MSRYAGESFSQRNQSLHLLGKSITFERQQTNSTTSSINATTRDINVNPIKHSQRIKQLFLPVCLHEVKHEIANHYRDVKNKRATRARAKAKRSVAALLRTRKKQRFSKLAATASTIIQRRRMGHRRRFLCQREVLQIPSFTFPRYSFQGASSQFRLHGFGINFNISISSKQRWYTFSLVEKPGCIVDTLRCLALGAKLIPTSLLFSWRLKRNDNTGNWIV